MTWNKISFDTYSCLLILLSYRLALHQNKANHQPVGKSDKTEDGEERQEDGGEIRDQSENAGLLLKFLVFQIEDDFTAWKNR